MGQDNLNRIFNPHQVAVVGPAKKQARAGVLRIGFRPGDGCGPGDWSLSGGG
jgi:hypothetical protein